MKMLQMVFSLYIWWRAKQRFNTAISRIGSRHMCSTISKLFSQWVAHEHPSSLPREVGERNAENFPPIHNITPNGPGYQMSISRYSIRDREGLCGLSTRRRSIK